MVEHLGCFKIDLLSHSEMNNLVHMSFSTCTDIHYFPAGAVVRNPPANAQEARDIGLIPGSGRSPGEGSPGTQAPGGLQSMGLKAVDKPE